MSKRIRIETRRFSHQRYTACIDGPFGHFFTLGGKNLNDVVSTVVRQYRWARLAVRSPAEYAAKVKEINEELARLVGAYEKLRKK